MKKVKNMLGKTGKIFFCEHMGAGAVASDWQKNKFEYTLKQSRNKISAHFLHDLPINK